MLTKTSLTSRNNWTLTIKRDQEKQQISLSLTDNFGIDRSIHQLLVFNDPQSSAKQLQEILLKLLHSPSKKDYDLQIYQHDNSTTVLYGPYGLSGAGREKIAAGLISLAGIASGCALIITGTPYGKILIDASTDLLFHVATEENISLNSCTKATLKGAAISIATLGFMKAVTKMGSVLSKAVPTANKTENAAKLATSTSKFTQIMKFGNVVKNHPITKQTAITMGQKVLAEIIHSGVEGYQAHQISNNEFVQWKEHTKAKYNKGKVLQIFTQELFISTLANSTAYIVEKKLLSKRGLYDLRMKNLLLKIRLSKRNARVVGKGIDTALQSSIRALTEEEMACALNKHRHFNQRSAAKIGIASLSGVLSGAIGKYKKVELERRIEKFPSIRQKLSQERKELYSKYGMNDKVENLITQLFESNKEIQLIQPLVDDSNNPLYKNLNELQQKCNLIESELRSIFKEKNLSLEQLLEDNQEISILEEKNLAEYIVTIDEYRLNGGNLNKLSDALCITYVGGKIGFKQDWIDVQIGLARSTPEYYQLIKDKIEHKKFFDEKLKHADEKSKKLFEFYDENQLNLEKEILRETSELNKQMSDYMEELNQTSKIIVQNNPALHHPTVIEILKDTDAYIQEQRSIVETSAFSSTFNSYVSSSEYFRVEEIDKAGKLSHDEIKKIQAELSSKLAKFAVEQHFNNKVLDPDQEALLREKYFEFKRLYDDGTTDQEFKRALTLLEEFMTMEGATLFLEQLPVADKIDNTTISLVSNIM